MIKELIVVEGKDDISAVKKSVDADVICTNGYGITEKTLKLIAKACETRGVIIFTDPDYAGEKIRRYINDNIHGCKNAFLPRHLGKKNNNIGIENAKPKDIKEALEKLKTVVSYVETFSYNDIFILGLISGSDSRNKRRYVGEKLGIGYCNSKQFINRLNNYGITKEQLIKTLKEFEF